ncbi:MAG TPA: NUDIX hydrolase, partial [Acidimicrobiales bacterium]|nr:NUDIX hydrolase [Acidimicrobiales bacterium]
MAGITDPNDPGRYAYLAEGNARQARKRVAAKVLIHDDGQRVLLVNPTYKSYWDLPGGMAEANEPPRAAAGRELREELGLTVAVGGLLLVEWVGPGGPWDDQLVFIFDGGTLDSHHVGLLRL